MSKELEALKILKTSLHNEWLRFYPQFKELDEKTKIVDGVRMVSSDADAFLTIEQALQRLEQIDNANFSEALEHIEILAGELGTSKDVKFAETRFPKMLITIQQSLLKAQENEKALKIIKEKCVSVWYLMKSKTVEEYNSYLYIEGIEDTKIFILTQEEFELLKRC